jgi:hypothetical protein
MASTKWHTSMSTTASGAAGQGEIYGNQHRQSSASQTREPLRLQEVQPPAQPSQDRTLERNGTRSQAEREVALSAEHDRRALIQGMKAAFAIELFAALFGLLAWGGYWLLRRFL